MKIKKPGFFWSAIIITTILILSYIIKVEITLGSEITSTPILGLLIFYNPFVLAIYVLIVLYLFYKSTGKKIKFV